MEGTTKQVPLNCVAKSGRNRQLQNKVREKSQFVVRLVIVHIRFI